MSFVISSTIFLDITFLQFWPKFKVTIPKTTIWTWVVTRPTPGDHLPLPLLQPNWLKIFLISGKFYFAWFLYSQGIYVDLRWWFYFQFFLLKYLKLISKGKSTEKVLALRWLFKWFYNLTTENWLGENVTGAPLY